MKKTSIFLLSIFVTISAAAADVSLTKAQTLAASLFNTTRAGGISLVWDGTDGTRSAEPLFYVFNNDGGGFVIISADDRAYPVLGYSDKGSFKLDGMPAQCRVWFENYGKQIEFIRNSGSTQSTEIANRWKKVTAPETIKDLNTAKWGQQEPFNWDIIDNCLTGCVATSTATIMYHHKWPKSTPGTKLPSYSYKDEDDKTVTVDGHNLATSYDWSDMLSSYEGSVSKSSCEAVATLMKDVAVALQLSFGHEGTSGYCEDVAPILIRHFDYDSSAVMIVRDGMTAEQWGARMKAEIDADRPVSYSASDRKYNTGHQFVLDGYGTQDTYHFNFGWNGDLNGLFRLEAINVPVSESVTLGFNYGQYAVVNIKPNQGGKSIDREKNLCFVITTDNKGGLSVISGTIATGNTVKIAAHNICNNNGGFADGTDMESVTAKYAMCLMDRNDKIKVVYGTSNSFNLQSGYFFSDTVACKITCDLNLGDKFVYCYNMGNGWIPVRNDYTTYNYQAGGKIYSTLDEIGAFDFPAIKINPEGYKAGDVLDLRLENCYYIPTIVWTIDDVTLDNGINSVRLTSGKHTIKADVTFYKTSVGGSAIRNETLVRVINVN